MTGINASSLLASGEIPATGSMTFTAQRNCWLLYSCFLQANSSGNVRIKLNDVYIVNFSSGEALSAQWSVIPIPLSAGDVLLIQQDSNRKSNYSIFAMS